MTILDLGLRNCRGKPMCLPYQPMWKKYNRFNAKRSTRSREELDIQLRILHYLKVAGAEGGKTKTTGAYDKGTNQFLYDPYTFCGFADIVVFYKCRLIFIEVKSKKGRLSPKQKRFKELCEMSNQIYILARELDDVIKVCDTIVD